MRISIDAKDINKKPIYVGDRVWVGDFNPPFYGIVTISGGEILAIGDEESIEMSQYHINNFKIKVAD